MPLLLSIGVFLLVAGGMTLLASRLWLRPRAVIERITGADVAAATQSQKHPSLAFRELLARLGNVLPASPRDVTVMQQRLIRAGYRGPSALKYLYGSKVLLAALLPLFAAIAVAGSERTAGNKAMLVALSAAAGFFAPNEYVRRKARRRQRQIRRGLPNALDLLVVCVESGLGLDQAIVQTAKELEHAHPEISEELALVNFELRAGKRRVEALRNLADRTDVEELRKLAAVLIQADRFGTSIAQTLRSHSDFMRVQARQQAEEKAAKLGVKLVFPIFFCILPSLFVVTVGPIMVRVVRELLPVIREM
ncbi:MAG: type II secretion system F family protein [Bryobacterales bacterium]|nr:type II secretion system F family protein [Bryobacteraceae bacterium]MDW8131721.1 type II secretion system F family protein [Bryobacterales bacterium]